nr:ribonuclease H-like domain-containing protein [Tanacetum cinerariifolium]
MDLCGPMRIESMNGKKYIMVSVEDYSRYTWTHFLRSKDETLEVLKDFLKVTQRNLQAQDIIENGNAPLITQVVEGVETTIALATAEEKAQRRLLRRDLEGMLLLKRLRGIF